MSSVIALRATGSADSDTANIKSAITQLTTPLLDYEPGTIILQPGRFRINESLVCGQYEVGFDTADMVHPPRIVGAGVVVLDWCGGETTDPMIKYQHPHSGVGMFLGNMYLYCQNRDTLERCRGIQVHGATYGHELRDVIVRSSRQVGIDMVNCWGGVLRNAFVWYPQGIGVRLTYWNSALMDTVFIKRGSPDDWPPTDDETVLWTTGDGYVRTPEDKRAGLVIYPANCSVAMNTVCEGNYYVTHPEISLRSVGDMQFNGIRFEYSQVTEDLIHVSAGRNVHITNPLYDLADAKSVIRATNYTRGICLDGGRYSVTDGALICDGSDNGDHAGHEVKRAMLSRKYSPDQEVPLNKWIVEENNPTMSGKITADSDRSVSIPWGRPI